MIQVAGALAAILLTGSLFARLFRLFGQPAAVAHMAAGLALGLFPSYFSPQARHAVSVLGAAGVFVYMFLVGLHFDAALLRSRLPSAWRVSLAGLAAPFVLGFAVAWAAWGGEGLFGPDVSRLMGALFVGAALSITAFPVLASILDELNITNTPAGALSLAAGCLDDVAAYVLLVILLAAGGAVPLASPAVAFALGAAARAAGLSRLFEGRWLRLAAQSLLVIYLAKSGLNTRLDLLPQSGGLTLAGALIAAACLGKLGGCYWAARAGGEDRRTAFLVGALMNTRGLMELIVLNIGLELGVIQPKLFSMLALMAVVTTLMAAPLARRASA